MGLTLLPPTEYFREEGRKEGLQEGLVQGRQEGREEVYKEVNNALLGILQDLLKSGDITQEAYEKQLTKIR